MTATSIPTRILCLGAGQGWHSNQLRESAAARKCELAVATYESLRAHVRDGGTRLESEAGLLSDFHVVLARTMPAGSFEQITFRLSMLHAYADGAAPIINAPRALEIAIDKFATLDRVARLGYPVPETIVVQSRGEAVEAFRLLGGDCVVKPIFGGEGRGVMRVRDPELAWTVFSTLENLGAVAYVQRFVSPGGRDTRLLVIGDEVLGIRRTSVHDFRTNVSTGGSCEAIRVADGDRAMALRICADIGLTFAAVDLIDGDGETRCVVEVNAIPGWKGAQRVIGQSIAQRIIDLLICRAGHAQENAA
jgi:RimK family alpha-L-glutamate ligase